ncbi:MAG: anti-sigma factor [Nevskia sp.]|nr:anti-sigma factor [Nevskia sp.]
MSEMNCEEARRLLPAYADGQLELSQALVFERHLEGCPDCAAALRAHQALSRAVRALPYHRAPDTLRARLQRQLAEAAPPQAAAPAAPPVAAPAAAARRPVPRRRELSRWGLPIAAALALAVGLNFTLATRRADQSLREELVAAQVRSLQVEHLNDVASTDQHTVKPWFAGKLDYAPPVRDLAQQGYPLVGGRLDYIARRQVAALVYHRRKHSINLYVWPARDGDEAPHGQVQDGYSLVHWCKDGMEYWAVSDLNGEELKQFAQLQIAAVSDQAANAPNT